MSLCLSCSMPMQGEGGEHHRACLRDLLGIDVVPKIDVDLARLHTLALAMAGRVSVSGMQKKLSVRLDVRRAKLQVASEQGRWLLKPQAGTFPNLPENEWVTQRLAARFSLEVPPCALVRLADDSWAYLVRRFDRLEAGTKLGMEDFCQLAEELPSGKYSGTAERCAKIVRRHASEPLVDLARLFAQFVFAWWVGNGDMHLKNLALLRGTDGRWRLSPVFDQLNTRLVLPDDALALPVCGKRDKLRTETFFELARHIGLGQRTAESILAQRASLLAEATAFVANSPLPAAMRDDYVRLLDERSRL